EPAPPLVLWIMNTDTRSSSRSTKKCVPAAPDQPKVPVEVRLPAAAESVTTRTPRRPSRESASAPALGDSDRRAHPPFGHLGSFEARGRRSRAAGRRNARRVAVDVEELRGSLRGVPITTALEHHGVTDDLCAEVDSGGIEPEQAERELVLAAFDVPPYAEPGRAQIARVGVVESAAARE